VVRAARRVAVNAEARVARRLGQHFLRDLNVVADTLDSLDLQPGEHVLEIGPGRGVLTLALAGRVGPEGRLVAVELDEALAVGLRPVVPPQVEVIHGDAVAVDLAALGPFDKVAGNLPYQISSPLTFRILDLPYRRAVFLYQLEFAERLAAGVGDPAYGRLSVARAYRATAEVVRRVRPGAFQPPPRVMSALVRLEPHAKEPFDIGGDVRFYDLVVRELFSQRRKTLRRVLVNRAATLGLPKLDVEEATAILVEADVTADRVEELDPPGYGRLTRVLAGLRREA
jgi:16S rRNA (adenine1518-N6/adenine1519-N6)-dimethyltransferase